MKFLQDNAIAYQDHAWGDGDLFADYECAPGIVVDKYQDGERWNVLISLRETKNKGDVVDFFIKRTVKNGFAKPEEWRQTTIQYPTKRLRLSVVFPSDRRCKRAMLLQRTRNKTTVLGHEHFLDLPDGRQVLTWETQNPRRFETYTMKWHW
ncbi:MAG: hypothetical protein J5I90_11420 [Caldilineales bacterium]|nr:hypothetical protein [Caldilineales bacterium]